MTDDNVNELLELLAEPMGKKVISDLIEVRTLLYGLPIREILQHEIDHAGMECCRVPMPEDLKELFERADSLLDVFKEMIADPNLN